MEKEFIFAGLILALVMKTGHKDAASGEVFAKKEIYFQQTQHAAIMAAIAAKPESVDMREAEKGNALQLFEYVPYKYEPCSRIYEHELAKVEKLIK